MPSTSTIIGSAASLRSVIGRAIASGTCSPNAMTMAAATAPYTAGTRTTPANACATERRPLAASRMPPV